MDSNSGSAFDLSRLPLPGLTLTSASRLAELKQTVSELTKQIEEFWSSGDFQLKQKRQDGENALHVVRESMQRELQSLRGIAETLASQLASRRADFDDKIREIEQSLVEKIKILEISYQKKLIQIVEQYQTLNGERNTQHADWTVQWNETRKQVEAQLLQTAALHADEVASNVQQNERIAEEKRLAREIEQETVRQLQQDSAEEVAMLKSEYEQKLLDERSDKVRLRGVGGIHRKHHEDLKKFLLQKDEELKAVQEECRMLADKIENLQKTKQMHILSIKQKDSALAEKEATILTIKKQNIELDKFKFVLDHKIKTLKNEIEPKNAVIHDMRDEIKHMDGALEQCHANNKQLHCDIENLQKQHDNLKNTLDHLKQDINANLTFIKTFKYQFGNLFDTHFTKDINILLKHFHQMQQTMTTSAAVNKDFALEVPESETQRQFLEKAVSGLKRAKPRKPEILNENIALIAEIEHLRKQMADLKVERAQRKLEMKRLMPV